MVSNESLELARLRTMARAYHDEAARLDREIAYRTGEVVEVFDQEATKAAAETTSGGEVEMSRRGMVI